VELKKVSVSNRIDMKDMHEKSLFNIIFMLPCFVLDTELDVEDSI